ncbi:MAG: hypothetical protein GY786_09525 [Proteobacteria bacterium]|nr:hypothetical protein [Pseudomonadota bacterium]
MVIPAGDVIIVAVLQMHHIENLKKEDQGMQVTAQQRETTTSWWFFPLAFSPVD